MFPGGSVGADSGLLGAGHGHQGAAGRGRGPGRGLRPAHPCPRPGLGAPLTRLLSGNWDVHTFKGSGPGCLSNARRGRRSGELGCVCL